MAELAELECDVAIIGAGTAGLAAERGARAAGARTLLIDASFTGTTCATVGCMPSKLLIAAGDAAHAVRRAPIFGIEVAAPRINGPAVMQRLRELRDRFVDGTLKVIDALPEGVRVKARASFAGSNILALDDGRTVRARAIVIAVGSRPRVPDEYKRLGDRLLTNETLFELPDLPRSVAVIGAGPLGLELAQALARLSVEVHVFDQGERLAGLHDEAIGGVLKNILRQEFPIDLGVTLATRLDGDGVEVSWSGKSSGRKRFERVLVAIGRPPQLGGLNLAATGLALDDKGTPLFNSATMQCGASSIFIAGDAGAKRAVLHEASDEGAIAGRNAASWPTVKEGTRNVPFSIMFTDPPVAVLGAGPDDNTVIGCASYEDQGRAKVEARNNGLVRIYADRNEGRLTGATLAGPGMDHIGHLLAWAIERRETATSLLSLPFYHPTFEEGLKSALRFICAETHHPLPDDRDEGSPSGG